MVQSAKKIMIDFSIILIISLFLATFITIKPENMKLPIQVKNPDYIRFDLTPHDPIKILEDADFYEDYDFPGMGSESDPYIIENYSIDLTDIESNYGFPVYGIEIRDTTKHFVIRNCHIINATWAIYTQDIGFNTSIIESNTCVGVVYYNNGIRCSSGVVVGNTIIGNDAGTGISCRDGVVKGNRIENCNTGIISRNFVLIEENNVSDNRVGIRVYEANSTIKQNMIINNGIGLSLRYSINTTILNNTLDSNYQSMESWSYLDDSAVIRENVFKNSEYRSYFSACNSTTFENNEFIHDELRFSYCFHLLFKKNQLLYSNIKFQTCFNNSIKNNQLVFGGVEISENSLEDYLNYTLDNNFINGKELGFFLNQSYINLDGDEFGQLILINCTNGSIRNIEISDTLNCLYLKYCDNFLIENNNFKNSWNGIYSEGSDNLEFISNTLDNCSCGLAFNFKNFRLNYRVSSLILKDNSFIRCGFKCSPFYSYSIGVINETGYRIILEEIPIIVENNKVNGKKLGYYTNLNNYKIKREKHGQIILVNCNEVTILNQDLSYTTTGIDVMNSSFINIEKCTSSYNSEYGIFFDYNSNNVSIINNECNYNGQFNNEISRAFPFGYAGILLYHSSGFLIKDNQCNENKNGIVVAISYFGKIIHNLVMENLDYGICIYGSCNFAYENTIIDNSGPFSPWIPSTEGFQAFSIGYNNTWYNNDTLRGNFWSDWDGTGAYLVGGLGDLGDLDLYPLSEPTWNIYGRNKLYALFSLVVVLPLGALVYNIVMKKKLIV